jgi:hypothetical protein
MLTIIGYLKIPSERKSCAWETKWYPSEKEWN